MFDHLRADRLRILELEIGVLLLALLLEVPETSLGVGHVVSDREIQVAKRAADARVAGLDRGYGRIFVLLAGGNLADVVQSGNKDAAKLRAQLEAVGITGEQIRELSRPIEPLRLAHRIDAEQLWLYSGKYDDVVPPASSFAFANAANLSEGHHIEMFADHYSGVIYLPMVIQEIRKNMDDPVQVDSRSE